MFRPLEAIVRSRFGILEGGVKFKVANSTGRGRWRAEISFFQMYYVGNWSREEVCSVISPIEVHS